MMHKAIVVKIPKYLDSSDLAVELPSKIHLSEKGVFAHPPPTLYIWYENMKTFSLAYKVNEEDIYQSEECSIALGRGFVQF